MSKSDVTAPVKSTIRTVPFGIFICGGLAMLALPVLLPLVCNAALPLADAERAKTFYLDNFSIALAIITTGGGLGAVGGSLSGRLGKIFAQLAPGVPTAATPGGEGFNGLAPKIPDLDAIGDELLASEIHKRFGFDIRDFNTGAPTEGESMPEDEDERRYETQASAQAATEPMRGSLSKAAVAKGRKEPI